MCELSNVPQRARLLGFKQYPRGTANTIGGCIRSAQAGANGARENICRHQVYFRYNCSSRALALGMSHKYEERLNCVNCLSSELGY